jgi:hypothetical protein
MAERWDRLIIACRSSSRLARRFTGDGIEVDFHLSEQRCGWCGGSTEGVTVVESDRMSYLQGRKFG